MQNVQGLSHFKGAMQMQKTRQYIWGDDEMIISPVTVHEKEKEYTVIFNHKAEPVSAVCKQQLMPNPVIGFRNTKAGDK